MSEHNVQISEVGSAADYGNSGSKSESLHSIRLLTDGKKNQGQ